MKYPYKLILIRHCLRILHLNISAIVLGLFVLSVTEARSEVVFRYGYDAAGNRVAREVVAQPRVAVASPPSVAVFPTITTGRVTIENRTSTLWKRAEYRITDTQGNTVATGILSGASAEIEVNAPNGVYLLNVIDRENVSSFKIIKQ